MYIYIWFHLFVLLFTHLPSHIWCPAVCTFARLVSCSCSTTARIKYTCTFVRLVSCSCSTTTRIKHTCTFVRLVSCSCSTTTRIKHTCTWIKSMQNTINLPQIWVLNFAPRLADRVLQQLRQRASDSSDGGRLTSQAEGVWQLRQRAPDKSGRGRLTAQTEGSWQVRLRVYNSSDRGRVTDQAEVVWQLRQRATDRSDRGDRQIRQRASDSSDRGHLTAQTDDGRFRNWCTFVCVGEASHTPPLGVGLWWGRRCPLMWGGGASPTGKQQVLFRTITTL